MEQSRYETQKFLDQYLLFHYGSECDLLPFSLGPKDSLYFPIRCVTECLDLQVLPIHAKALELGCAVGRSSFELTRFCEKVLAVDQSRSFITAAQHIQQTGEVCYTIEEEADNRVERVAKLPENTRAERVEFRCCSVMELFQERCQYDVVLAANLICRLSDPTAFLKRLPELVVNGGQFIMTSPYSWLEEFTPQSNWIKADCLDHIQQVLEDSFELQRYFDMPFLMREHFRKYQWGVSQASIWKRK